MQRAFNHSRSVYHGFCLIFIQKVHVALGWALVSHISILCLQKTTDVVVQASSPQQGWSHLFT